MTKFGRRSATSSVTYLGIPTQDVPVEIHIRQGFGMHDVVELAYQQKQPWMSSLWGNTPVQINWGSVNGASRFVGYVSHSSPMSTVSINQAVKVYLIGASFPLKERGTEVWVDMTAPQIAADIARRFRLQAITDPGSYIIPQVAQAGRTFWEVLNEVAERDGYVVRCDGVSIIFRKRDGLINSGMPLGLQFSLGGEKRTMGNNEGRTLWHFRPRLGKYIEVDGPRADQSVSGVDPRTGEVFTNITSPGWGGESLRLVDPGTRFTEYAIEQTAHSSFVAQRVSAARAENVRMSVTADAVMTGDARVRPGVPVYIRDTGTATDGYWMVSSVTHKIKAGGEYEMEAGLVTDSIGAAKAGAFRPGSPPNLAVRDLGPAATTTPAPLLTPNLLPAKVGSKDQFWTCGGAV